MPPKHKMNRKHNVQQSTLYVQTGESTISNADVIDSSHSDCVETNEEFPIDSTTSQSTNDFITILSNDRPYVRISKQIMQYETKRRRHHLKPNSVRSHLEDAEIPLQTSITSDWRVISQDSITNDHLQKGCISLFKQEESGAELSPSEANHAIRFLEYTTMFFKDGCNSSEDFFRNIFSYDFPRTTFTSSLLKMISHPSETLRAVALAFFSTVYSHQRSRFYLMITNTDFFTNLLSLLKPHEIPFSDTTMDFHRHVTSIMFHFIDKSESLSKKPLSPETVASILQAFCPYLRHLLVHPAFFPWKHIWMTFDSILQKFEMAIHTPDSRSSHPELVQFVDEMKNSLSEELASLIGLADQKETAKCLLFDEQDSTSTSDWVKAFEFLLAHADEGRHFSDVGMQSILIFLKRRPKDTQLIFADDGKFTIREKDKLVSSSKHDVRSLWALLTPTDPQHVPAFINAAHFVSFWINTFDEIKHFWIGWLSHFLNAVDASHQPFTPQNFSLHARLVDVIHDIINSFGQYEHIAKFSQPAITQSELKASCLSFLNLSKEYLVHLSHNVFGTHPHDDFTIDDLLSKVMRFDLKTPTTEAFRRELKEEMISSGLASSSPPFILTAELVCPLSDCETMDVVDRIVGLLDRDCSLDDSTILWMCVFIARHNTRSLQLAFRSTGRTKEEYFHAFESFLSLHVESFQQAPISSLLSSRPDDHEPTLDEWDEADLETVPIVVRMKSQNKLSIDTDSENFDSLFVDFVLGSLQQARHCATRLTRTQLERLIAPSIDFLDTFFHRPSSHDLYNKQWMKVFRGICSVCDQPVVARAISSTGIFCRVVNSITLCRELSWSIGPMTKLIDDMNRSTIDSKTSRMLRRDGFPTIKEEGLEDAIEIVHFLKPDTNKTKTIKNQTRDIHLFFGVNLPDLHSDDVLGYHPYHFYRFYA
ncbi:hypothetical protein BLNAU_8067 [Blattamonas nauphoetae]|uniref:Uncharacterized protein n=1 Tax=Blattamonas nauphoetae TaxID=2049346 RepID=A0ABQ9XZR7_9EUKA|nr:hypothetical protein BLNAU_8067 [Blattamonas nauphoetae]